MAQTYVESNVQKRLSIHQSTKFFVLFTYHGNVLQVVLYLRHYLQCIKWNSLFSITVLFNNVFCRVSNTIKRRTKEYLVSNIFYMSIWYTIQIYQSNMIILANSEIARCFIKNYMNNFCAYFSYFQKRKPIPYSVHVFKFCRDYIVSVLITTLRYAMLNELLLPTEEWKNMDLGLSYLIIG